IYLHFLRRVFKKTSPNSKLSIYLGKRDFVDHVESVDSVDGHQPALLGHSPAGTRRCGKGELLCPTCCPLDPLSPGPIGLAEG
uniref:Uncharacterized protein n=1 Tax=Strix occidentalis caurina TaxID=311401 RepID=A0A8D0KUH8_STROC